MMLERCDESEMKVDLQQTPAGVLKFQIIIGGDVIEMRPDMSRISKIVILLSFFHSRFEGFEFLPSTHSEAAGPDIYFCRWRFGSYNDPSKYTPWRFSRDRYIYVYIYNI